MKKHDMLHDSNATLKNIINKDMVTPEIQESWLAAESLGTIKSSTEVKRKQRHRPVRRNIENDSTVPLPSDWSSFTSLVENRADLAILLSPHLIEHNSTESPVIVVAGGFSDQLPSSHLT